MRTLIDYFPFLDLSEFWSERGRWPAKWVTHPLANGSGAVVQAFRRTFAIEKNKTVRIHVSADERYELYLDGQRIGRGPERGDRAHWRFETYDLSLTPGQHTLVARTWWLSRFGPSPFAQMTVQPGFLLAAETSERELLNTGFAPWETKILGGYRYLALGSALSAGAKVHISGKDFAWDFEQGGGDGWSRPNVLDWAHDINQLIDQNSDPSLVPATLPAMLERTVHVGIARHVQELKEIPRGEMLVQDADNLKDEIAGWNRLFAGDAPVMIPPRTIRRVIVDLQNYYCGYTDLVTSGGAGAIIRSYWAEALYLPKEQDDHGDRERVKGNRDEIEGKTFIGIGDVFEPDGGTHRLFNTLWWEAGRYLEVIVATADQALTIESFSLRETHYPHEWSSQFETSDARFADLTPITRRAMEMCSHETYMDCPYYEQMMYVGDGRLEVLTTYACTGDDRLPRKAVQIFDDSRKSPGFTQSRYPSRVEQTIPPFSAWWLGMVYDYAMWRDDAAFVRTLMPAVRSVLDTFLIYKTSDGLIAGPPGWNFMDWVPGWVFGIPPEGDVGKVSAPLNFQLAWTLKQAAELEDAFGEKELAALQRRRATEISSAARSFWDDSRGLFSDDLKHTRFSEHTQCLALLGDSVDAANRAQVIDHLFTDETISRTTVYFSHYLFETCAMTGRIAPLFDRLKLWFDLKANGFKTTLESPEPSRSDCHAWGAHPMYHYYATILGIRPAAAGFSKVNITPQLGPLGWAKGQMAHPKGTIEVDFKQSNQKVTGNVKLPTGVAGTLWVNGRSYPLQSGLREF